MYAFISNEYRAVVQSQRQLDLLISIYSYPKFCRVESIEEARKFWANNERKYSSKDIIRYNNIDKVSYLTVEYFISDNTIYVNIFTKNFGFVKFSKLPENIVQECSFDLIKLKINNVVLDESLIAHHCIAINYIFRVIGPYINCELILPDLSVYLAITRYTGNNITIRKARNELDSRFGFVYYSIKR